MNLKNLRDELDEGWNTLSSWCSTEVGSTTEELNNGWKELQKAGIRDVVAPLHRTLTANARNSENDLLNVQVDQFKTEWKSYATDVDTDAKGKWAAAAKKEITDQADKLDAIMPDMHILF